MMRRHETKIRLLVVGEILFQPLYLLAPKTVLRRFIRRYAADVAVQHAEMSLTPVEGIIRFGGVEELVVVMIVALVISERREKRCLAQQLAFDVEKNGPERGVGAILHHVARL